MEGIRLVIVFLFVLVLGSVQGQSKYAIHYKYKPQSTYSLDRPQEFLTVKAIERRERYAIPLDSMDLPVSEKYIEEISELTESILYHISWFNASLVVATETQIEEIEALDFVDKVVYAAPIIGNGARLIQKIKKGFNLKLNLKNAKTTSNVYDFQNGLLGFQEMHELGFKGEGITIAVFDAGFPDVNNIAAFSHLFENQRVIGGKDFVDLNNQNIFFKNQHGMNVLSVIASNKPGELVAGAPNANYILCITEDTSSEYRIEEYNWVKAATYADSLGVDIINSSLGYFDFDDSAMDYNILDLNGQTAIITLGANIAQGKGILVVTSAGNYGSLGESTITAPADAQGILSIGAVNSSLERAGFSSRGPTSDGRIKPELSTLGQGVYIYVRPNISVSQSSGTSFSAPQITALAAGLWQAKREWTKDELIDALIQSGSQYDSPNNELGYGIPNFSRAYFGEVLSIENSESEIKWKVFPNPLEGSIINVEFGNSLEASFLLINSTGSILLSGEINRKSSHNPFEITAPNLPVGVYVLEVRDATIVRRIKLIKK
ncbi:Por secretion system C-terminal sorting domain-containing protein [Belliella buryatensis]|uniref:Por secretion system C-terminal sorting domain-containing protein n=1 Tax=Belliella buryatensis TaxID=1500549 RepID=A0A239D6W5_9BACT|nr:S8 family serine peptidase [Belliella buryatensis]SNS27604.1 Por secretion system C-terminal sorting domain-containing protein [Belliella buryatensis]